MKQVEYDLKVMRPVSEIKTVSVQVDCEQTAGRYTVTLSYDASRKVYMVSAPNYYISIERDSGEAIKSCSYKLQEKGMKSGDADVIEAIVTKLLYPSLGMYL